MNDVHHQFRRSLIDLKYCGSTNIYPHVFLPTEDCGKMAANREESFPSKLLCVLEAEHKLRALHSEAQKTLVQYADPLSPDSFLSTFQTALTTQLTSLRDKLAACRTPGNVAIVNRILGHLVPDAVFAEMAECNQELQAKYILAGFETYRSLVVYDKHDPSEFEEGIAKLVAMAFCRHGYDLFPVIQKIETDATALLREYQTAFDAQASLSIQKNIIAPVQSKLPLLRGAQNERS